MNQEFDQLFRDKLQNHEAQPSAEAWAKLQGKLPRKDRKPFWFVAFGVLLCGMGVAYWYFGMGLTENQNLERKENAFDQKIEKVEKNAEPEATKNTQNQSVLERANLERKQNTNHVFVPNLEKKAVLEKKNTKQVLKQESQTEKTVLEKRLEKRKEVKTVLEEKIEAKSESKTEANVETQTEKTAEKPNEVQTEAEPEMPITVIIKAGDQASNRQEPLQETDSLVKKKPRFLRILKQLHNFKEGEKVNFQDLKRDKE